jgi:acyl-CoA synthetase (AMP-forming)/AMP-acid ligase II/aryl carrier-like protein
MLSIQVVSEALQLAKLGNVVTVDSFDPSTASKFDPQVQIHGSDAAYCVFTSERTGTPKGVVVTQQNLLSNLKVLSNVYPVRHQGKLLQACSQPLDVSGFEIFFAWYTGMCICTATNDVLFHDLEASIRELEITHLSLTPTIAALVHPENVPSVEFLVMAGEGVTEKVLRTWAGHGLYQGYGPSETTNICTVKPNVQEDDLINDIGQPFKNTSAFVYRPGTDELVVKGGVGELCFGGDQIFVGYLQMPSLTDQKLIHHPQYGRIYRSGDLGRLLPDGSILFSGRVDDQVKVRGQRVELGEINHALLSQSSTQNCVTLYLREPGTGSEKIVSFVVLGNSRTPTFGAVSPDDTVRTTLKSLLDALSRQLPSYMIPSYLVPVTELPMTDQGKIDKAKLSGFYENLSSDYLNGLGHGTDRRIATEVWSSTELKLAGVVACTLQTPQQNINKHLSLFTLGLDSITAISLARSIREAFRHEVTVSTILLHPTISRLAAAMASTITQAEQTPVNLSEVFTPETWYDIEAKVELLGQQDAIEALLPCTPLQEAMLSATLSADTNAYCNSMEFEIRGDPEKVLKSWANMVQKHAILRTCFIPTKQMDYPYAQVVLSTYTERRSIITIGAKSTGRDVTNDVEKLTNRVKVALQTPLPPYVLELVRFSDITVLQFVCHHALYDAAAMNQLIREIELDYYDRILPQTTPYELFFEKVIAARSGPAIEFWTKKLEGVQPTLFKVSNSPRRRTVPSPVNSFEVPLNKVQAAAQRHQVSMLALLQAAWVKVLHAIFDRDEICFGAVFNGREGAHKLLVAPTFNTLPVRINLRRHDTNASAISELQDYNGQALKHHLVPLRAVQQRLGVSGGLFSTLFLLQQSEYQLDDQIWTLKTDDGAMNVRYLQSASFVQH